METFEDLRTTVSINSIPFHYNIHNIFFFVFLIHFLLFFISLTDSNLSVCFCQDANIDKDSMILNKKEIDKKILKTYLVDQKKNSYIFYSNYDNILIENQVENINKVLSGIFLNIDNIVKEQKELIKIINYSIPNQSLDDLFLIFKNLKSNSGYMSSFISHMFKNLNNKINFPLQSLNCSIEYTSTINKILYNKLGNSQSDVSLVIKNFLGSNINKFVFDIKIGYLLSSIENIQEQASTFNTNKLNISLIKNIDNLNKFTTKKLFLTLENKILASHTNTETIFDRHIKINQEIRYFNQKQIESISKRGFIYNTNVYDNITPFNSNIFENDVDRTFYENYINQKIRPKITSNIISNYSGRFWF